LKAEREGISRRLEETQANLAKAKQQLDRGEAERVADQVEGAAVEKKIEELKTASADTADIEAVSAEQQRYTLLRRSLRDIGDGIAWRLLEYDRAALVSLASHPRKPHINVEGLPAELNAFAEMWNSYPGSLLVLNDLTHFLKKADVTVRRDADHFEFVEVKSSRTKSGTMSRQKADLAETLAFLNEQEGERHAGSRVPSASYRLGRFRVVAASRPIQGDRDADQFRRRIGPVGLNSSLS